MMTSRHFPPRQGSANVQMQIIFLDENKMSPYFLPIIGTESEFGQFSAIIIRSICPAFLNDKGIEIRQMF